MSDQKKFYITTAIAYASQKPHIGNVYDPVLADAIARYKRMLGFDTYFVTGTDEHGQKIENLATAAGIEPQKYVDDIAKVIRDIWDLMNVDYQYFVRTTDQNHVEAIQAIFKKMYEQGDIYKGSYDGKYCLACEAFWTPTQLVDGKCPDCGREVTDASEEAYFFRLSKYQDKLVEFYDSNPNFFTPESRKHEMINNFIKPGLQDLCVSRTSFKWGIPVDFDDKHVVYVWLDALSNYITAIGYNPNGSSENYAKYWPADLHVIGKDIVRFHTIYWPAFLMSLEQPLPKQVLGHPWVLVGDDKMSKSTGNVIYADDLVKFFGVDAVRYYLLSQIPFAQDGSITYENVIATFNSDLANTLGNLVNRTVAMTNKYFGGTVTKPSEISELDRELTAFCAETVAKYTKFMDIYHNADAAGVLMDFAARCNKYIDETTPWVLAKDEAQMSRLNDVLYNLLECIRVLAVLYSPFMPETADKILAQLGVIHDGFTADSIQNFGDTESYSVTEATPLFARIDSEKMLAEIEATLPKKAEPAHENVAFLSEISIDDFMKIDLRAAKITDCEAIKKSKKLLKLTLDDGSGTNRTVCSGISQWYKPDDLIGKSIIVVSNLKPAKLCGVESNGMILAADDGDDVKVIFVDGITPGSRIR